MPRDYVRVTVLVSIFDFFSNEVLIPLKGPCGTLNMASTVQ